MDYEGEYQQSNRSSSSKGTASYDEGAEGSNHRASGKKKRYADDLYSQRISAGKRTYFFDVKSTRSGEDFFITITESKRLDDGRYEKHKLFLYKEDFGKFARALHEAIDHIRDECLPDYEFDDLPEVTDTDDYADDY